MKDNKFTFEFYAVFGRNFVKLCWSLDAFFSNFSLNFSTERVPNINSLRVWFCCQSYIPKCRCELHTFSSGANILRLNRYQDRYHKRGNRLKEMDIPRSGEYWDKRVPN